MDDSPAEGFLWLPLDLTGHTRLPELPRGAVVAGHEGGRPTFVGRVKSADGGWELGKLSAWARFAYGHFGREVETAVGEVLITRDDYAPVWVGGGHGEHVPAVLMSKGPGGFQSVARAWHQGRWVPGKVVHACRQCFLPFGGRELAVRKYQLLSTGFVWQTPAAGGGIPPNAVCTDDQPPRLSHPSNLIRAPGSDAVLVKTGPAREAAWQVSGDGDWVRHALAAPDGRPLARVWLDGRDGTAGWVAACVDPPGLCCRPGAARVNGRRFPDYQVLTAGAPEPGPRMLTLHLQLDAAGHVVNSPSSPDKDVLLATALERGQSPWVAVVQMVSVAEEQLRQKAAAEQQQQQQQQQQQEAVAAIAAELAERQQQERGGEAAPAAAFSELAELELQLRQRMLQHGQRLQQQNPRQWDGAEAAAAAAELADLIELADLAEDMWAAAPGQQQQQQPQQQQLLQPPLAPQQPPPAAAEAESDIPAIFLPGDAWLHELRQRSPTPASSHFSDVQPPRSPASSHSSALPEALLLPPQPLQEEQPGRQVQVSEQTLCQMYAALEACAAQQPPSRSPTASQRSGPQQQQPGSPEAGSEGSFAMVQPEAEQPAAAAASQQQAAPARAAVTPAASEAGSEAGMQWEALKAASEPGVPSSPCSSLARAAPAPEPGYLSDHTSDGYDFLDDVHS